MGFKKEKIVIAIVRGICVAWVLLFSPGAISDEPQTTPVVIKPTVEVEFNDYFVTNVQADQERKYIKLKIAMTVKDKATADAVNNNQPLLRNAVLLSLSAEQYGRLKSDVGKKAFQERLQKEMIELLKTQRLPHAIETLSFTEFLLD